MLKRKTYLITTVFILFVFVATAQEKARTKINFNKGWKFNLSDTADAKNEAFDDSKWRMLNLPHDWRIEMPFDSTSPTGTGGGALRGGIGWYRKTFELSETDKTKLIYIDFDGVYRNSEVFINGQSLGVRPNGYISFRSFLSPYLKYGNGKNIIAVKVDNSKQPNSRWYSGSGIYRNVWMVKTGNVYTGVHVAQWGTFVTTPQIESGKANINIKTKIECGG